MMHYLVQPRDQKLLSHTDVRDATDVLESFSKSAVEKQQRQLVI